MQTQLSQLRRLTRIVADTGDFASMKAYSPEDATTNPSLILKAIQKKEYQYLLQEAIAQEKALGHWDLVASTIDRLLILFGCEILKIVPGRVSTEIDARLSFDTLRSIQKAKMLVDLYDQCGIDRDRILIKLVATWEGIQAAQVLEKEGIHCNMTLLFSMPQAVAAAQAGVTLISPFVGRILDWHKAKSGRDFMPSEDPGVLSVTQIYNYYKHFDYPTEVMGASFRNKGEILELAGCDLLTISPTLLEELSRSTEEVPLKLSAGRAKNIALERMPTLDEPAFRWMMNQDLMATDKLGEGIRIFYEDAQQLAQLIGTRLGK